MKEGDFVFNALREWIRFQAEKRKLIPVNGEDLLRRIRNTPGFPFVVIVEGEEVDRFKLREVAEWCAELVGGTVIEGGTK